MILIPSESCTQDLRCSDTVTASTGKCPTGGVTQCGAFGDYHYVWLGSIIGVEARVTLSLCGGGNLESDMTDTIIHMLKDNVEGICVSENDDHNSCNNRYLGLITFDAVETKKYIVLVTGFAATKGAFTLLVECDQPRLEPSKELSEEPSSVLSSSPSVDPSMLPSSVPSILPSTFPSNSPEPSKDPSGKPS